MGPSGHLDAFIGLTSLSQVLLTVLVQSIYAPGDLARRKRVPLGIETSSGRFDDTGPPLQPGVAK